MSDSALGSCKTSQRRFKRFSCFGSKGVAMAHNLSVTTRCGKVVIKNNEASEIASKKDSERKGFVSDSNSDKEEKEIT